MPAGKTFFSSNTFLLLIESEFVAAAFRRFDDDLDNLFVVGIVGLKSCRIRQPIFVTTFLGHGYSLSMLL